MTDTNSTPTPPGDSASGGHTPASQQPVPLQPTQPAPYSAQGAQPYGGQQAYTGQAGKQRAMAPSSPMATGLSRRRFCTAFCRTGLRPANLRG